jgi:hypothetical protein
MPEFFQNAPNIFVREIFANVLVSRNTKRASALCYADAGNGLAWAVMYLR